MTSLTEFEKRTIVVQAVLLKKQKKLDGGEWIYMNVDECLSIILTAYNIGADISEELFHELTMYARTVTL